MISLSKFELIKIIRRKWIWVMFIVFLLVNFYNIFFVYENVSSENSEAYTEIYEIIKGPLSEEKIEFVVSHYKQLRKELAEYNANQMKSDRYYTGYLMGDYNLFQDFYKELKYAYNNKKIDSFYYMDDTERFIKYDFSTLLMVLIIILVVTASVLEDRNSGMRSIEKCCYNGAVKIIISKAIAIVLFAVMLVTVFSISDTINFSVRWNIEGLEQPLCAIKLFEQTNWNANIFDFLVFKYILEFAGLLFFAIATYIVSEITKNIKFTIVIVLGIYVICIYLSIVDKEITNPILLFDNWELWR